MALAKAPHDGRERFLRSVECQAVPGGLARGATVWFNAPRYRGGNHGYDGSTVVELTLFSSPEGTFRDEAQMTPGQARELARALTEAADAYDALLEEQATPQS